MHRVVIAGAGFGGVRAALKLAKSKNCHVTIISDRDTFRYYPALYATATGHSHKESIIPLSEIFESHPNIEIKQDTVKTLNTKTKRIKGSSGKWYEYDSLIIALGVVTNYFGIKGLEEYSYGIKSQEEVDELKNHLHDNLADSQKLDPNYVIVGAGATGVELAASLRAYIEAISYSHEINEHDARVEVVEAMDRVLPRMSPYASKLVQKRLQKLGIKLILGARVEGETAHELSVAGQRVPTDTVIWTSGVSNNPFFKANEKRFNLAQNGKVKVDEFLQGAPCVYVIGDNADTKYSGLAQTALYDADFAAKNIMRQTKHLKPRRYKPRRPPVVIPVGKRWAIFEWRPFTFGGRVGAVLRRAADLIAYHDILPLGKAVSLWRKASKLEESCPVCQESTSSSDETVVENS